MQIYKVKAKSDKWLELRKQVVTGTEIAALFGLHPYSSVPKVVRGKKGEEPSIDDNAIMRAGRMMESVCVASARELGYDVEEAAETGKVCFVTKEKMLGVSLDALIGNDPVECKSTERLDKFNKWLATDLPAQYLLQIHSQILCLGVDKGYLVMCHSLPPFATIVYEVKGNKKLNKILLDSCSRFWDTYRNGEKYNISQVDKKEIIEILPKTFKLLSTSWLPQNEEEEITEEIFK